MADMLCGGQRVNQSILHGFTKGKNCLNNIVTFCDGVDYISGQGKSPWMSCMHKAPTASYSLDWREMDLMGALFAE